MLGTCEQPFWLCGAACFNLRGFSAFLFHLEKVKEHEARFSFIFAIIRNMFVPVCQEMLCSSTLLENPLSSESVRGTALILAQNGWLVVLTISAFLESNHWDYSGPCNILRMKTAVSSHCIKFIWLGKGLPDCFLKDFYIFAKLRRWHIFMT